MLERSIPALHLMVSKLTTLLVDINHKLHIEAPTGACLYSAGGQSQCAVTTETTCVIGLQGRFIGGPCLGQSARPIIPLADVDEETVERLVRVLNDENSKLLDPAPLGTCCYASETGEKYVMTTERACTIALMGVFSPVETFGEPTTADVETDSRGAIAR